MKKVNDSKRTYMLITIPILALFVCFNTVPLIRGVIYSFTNFKGFGTYDFVGFRNYMDLFTDPRIGGSYLFTIKLAIAATIVTNVISLVLALGLNSKIKGKIMIAKDMSQDDIRSYVLTSDLVKPFIEGKVIKKFIVVPGRLVNIIL